jgi:hypothetical protein
VKEENKKEKKIRELAEREEFWKDIRREADNLALAMEQREKKQKISKIKALNPSSLAKLIHSIQKQDKSLLHIIKDIDTDFITSIYSPSIKFNKEQYNKQYNKQYNNQYFSTFDNTTSNIITNEIDKTNTFTANKSMGGYKRKSKHYKSKHKRYKNTNRKINRRIRRSSRRPNKKR